MFKKIEKLILEDFDSTLENEVMKSLRIIKKRVEKIFIGEDFVKYSDYIKSTNGVLKDSNLSLLDSKIVAADPVTDYYKIRLADNEFEYAYTFLVSLEDNFVNYSKSDKEPNRVFNTDLTFKKYDITTNTPTLVSEINKTIAINEIDEDLFISLNVEADDYDDTLPDPEIDSELSDEELLADDNVIVDEEEDDLENNEIQDDEI